MKQDQQRTIYLKDYRPADFAIKAAEFVIHLDPRRTRVETVLTMYPRGRKSAELTLDVENIEIETVAIDGKPLSRDAYAVEGDTLMIARPPRKDFKLEIVSYCDPEANKALSGLYRSRGVYCTQCEAEGFRRIAPYLDRPDVLAKFRVRLEAEKAEAPVLLSNGNLVESGDLPGGRHYVVWDDPHPKPSYLFALVGGDLAHIADEFTTASGRHVELRIYCERGKEERCHWAMDSLKRSMAWDERRFGLEYDLDVFNIVAVSDFNMGAMENKGLNIFNDKLILADPETATDGEFEHIEAVVAHEYFHNWTGNRVTCRDWFQLCLKEGLTVFRDQEFTSDERSRPVKRIDDVRLLKSRQFVEDAGPLAHPVRPDSFVEINNFYTLTVYEKGAELCRMLQTLFGVEGFRKGVDLYFERHDGQAVTVEDWLAAMADANGADLKQFKLWYTQAGTPELKARLTYSKATKTTKLKLKQSYANSEGKKPLQIPVKIGLIGKDGSDLYSEVMHLTKRRQTFAFEGLAERPVLSVLRDFSAPVKLSVDYKDSDLLFLMARDSNTFNRWQAAHIMAGRLLIAAAKGVDAAPRTGSAFIKALGETLADGSLEPAYRAHFAALPSERDIALDIGENVDPEAIHHARRKLKAKIGAELRKPLTALYQSLRIDAPYLPDAHQSGQRALRNAALNYLAHAGETGLVEAHYREARNMTDAVFALAGLLDEDAPQCEAALRHFYDRWRGDHLVIDKWFGLQAGSSSPRTLSRLQTLRNHELFNMSNPNKVRAVYGAFAHGNQSRFHDASGEGYRIVSEAVMELDSFNPQVAARLAGAFESWRMMEPGRRTQAEAAIRAIAAKPGLSRDTQEIVSKILT
jgi:aminopeptidase N